MAVSIRLLVAIEVTTVRGKGPVIRGRSRAILRLGVAAVMAPWASMGLARGLLSRIRSRPNPHVPIAFTATAAPPP